MENIEKRLRPKLFEWFVDSYIKKHQIDNTLRPYEKKIVEDFANNLRYRQNFLLSVLAGESGLSFLYLIAEGLSK